VPAHRAAPQSRTAKTTFENKELSMKHISILVLALTLGAASVQAREQPVQMTYSGSGAYLAPPINLVPGGNSPLSDLTVAGDGSLGPFTLHEVAATTATPTSAGCAAPDMSAAFAFVKAAGIFRFQDGSLLTYELKAGTSCIDFTKGFASSTITEQITGGTGRFKNASGTLTIKVPMSYPVLFDSTMTQPILIAFPNAVVTGTIVLPDPE
jgi:hypothetical protein